jgi:hypothetical protein
MTHAMEFALRLEKVVLMSSRMQQIKAICAEIEEMKRRIILLHSDIAVSYREKTQRLEEMRHALFITEHLALKLLQDEVLDESPNGGNGDDT